MLGSLAMEKAHQLPTLWKQLCRDLIQYARSSDALPVAIASDVWNTHRSELVHLDRVCASRDIPSHILGEPSTEFDQETPRQVWYRHTRVHPAYRDLRERSSRAPLTAASLAKRCPRHIDLLG